MRELNPRAWSIDSECWCTRVDYDGYKEEWSGIVPVLAPDNRSKRIGEVEDTNIIVEFPTGIKDKNGQKIYEGDIVNFLVERFNNVTLGFESEDWHTAVVEWNQDDACYSFMVRDVPFSVRYEAEVIGNIHKQPELLEANDVD